MTVRDRRRHSDDVNHQLGRGTVGPYEYPVVDLLPRLGLPARRTW